MLNSVRTTCTYHQHHRNYHHHDHRHIDAPPHKHLFPPSTSYTPPPLHTCQHHTMATATWDRWTTTHPPTSCRATSRAAGRSTGLPSFATSFLVGRRGTRTSSSRTRTAPKTPLLSTTPLSRAATLRWEAFCHAGDGGGWSTYLLLALHVI